MDNILSSPTNNVGAVGGPSSSFSTGNSTLTPQQQTSSSINNVIERVIEIATICEPALVAALRSPELIHECSSKLPTHERLSSLVFIRDLYRVLGESYSSVTSRMNGTMMNNNNSSVVSPRTNQQQQQSPLASSPVAENVGASSNSEVNLLDVQNQQQQQEASKTPRASSSSPSPSSSQSPLEKPNDEGFQQQQQQSNLVMTSPRSVAKTSSRSNNILFTKFYQALCGHTNTPCPPDQDEPFGVPRLISRGLCHGDTEPLRKLLKSSPVLLKFFVQNLIVCDPKFDMKSDTTIQREFLRELHSSSNQTTTTTKHGPCRPFLMNDDVVENNGETTSKTATKNSKMTLSALRHFAIRISPRLTKSTQLEMDSSASGSAPPAASTPLNTTTESEDQFEEPVFNFLREYPQFAALNELRVTPRDALFSLNTMWCLTHPCVVDDVHYYCTDDDQTTNNTDDETTNNAAEKKKISTNNSNSNNSTRFAGALLENEAYHFWQDASQFENYERSVAKAHADAASAYSTSTQYPPHLKNVIYDSEVLETATKLSAERPLEERVRFLLEINLSLQKRVPESCWRGMFKVLDKTNTTIRKTRPLFEGAALQKSKLAASCATATDHALNKTPIPTPSLKPWEVGNRIGDYLTNVLQQFVFVCDEHQCHELLSGGGDPSSEGEVEMAFRQLVAVIKWAVREVQRLTDEASACQK